MICTLKNKDNVDTKVITEVLDTACLLDGDTGEEKFFIVFLSKGFYVFNPVVWDIDTIGCPMLDFSDSIFDCIFASIRRFLKDNTFLNFFRFSSEYYSYSELDTPLPEPDELRSPKKLKVRDIVNTYPDDSAILRGANPLDPFDAFRDWYFEGLLKDIPEKYLDCEVLGTGWLMVAKRYAIDIPFLSTKKGASPQK